MKPSFLSALLVVGVAALTLSGCDGGTFEILEKAPVAFQRNTAKPRAQVTACIADKLSRFGSDLGVFPDIEPGVTRMTLGGELFHYENYYQINVIDQNGGTHVSVRQSKQKDENLPVNDLFNIVSSCVG